MTTTLKWLGHAAFEIKTGGKTLLVDPYLTDNPLASMRSEDAVADYILITHGHFDHVGDSISIATRTGATVIANPEISAWCSRQCVASHPLQTGSGFAFPFGYLKLTEAVHGSNLPDGSNGGSACGFLLTTLDEKKIYLAGDTSFFDGMRLIGEEGIDFAALPIGGYYTMDPDDALHAVKLLRPTMVLPIHYNTNDHIHQDPAQWTARVLAETSTKVALLKPGESVEI